MEAIFQRSVSQRPNRRADPEALNQKEKGNSCIVLCFICTVLVLVFTVFIRKLIDFACWCRFWRGVLFVWEVISWVSIEDVVEKGFYSVASCCRRGLDDAHSFCTVIPYLVMSIFHRFLFRYHPNISET